MAGSLNHEATEDREERRTYPFPLRVLRAFVVSVPFIRGGYDATHTAPGGRLSFRLSQLTRASRQVRPFPVVSLPCRGTDRPCDLPESAALSARVRGGGAASDAQGRRAQALHRRTALPGTIYGGWVRRIQPGIPRPIDGRGISSWTGRTPSGGATSRRGVQPPTETLLYAFSYTVPTTERGQTFVVSGAPEKANVRPGETSPDALRKRRGARCWRCRRASRRLRRSGLP